MSDNILILATVADELEEFISQAVPDSRTVNKYGGTLFTLKPEEKEGQFCGVFIYKNHVQISFSNGAELDDPRNLLSGSGTRRRHWNFSDLTDVEYDALRRLLIQASKLSVSC